MDDKTRVWFTRVAAPLVFLAAATLLVILVQRALDGDEDAGSNVPVQTVSVSTQVSESETVQPEQRFYQIKTGDTLQAIAQRFETTVDELEQLNPGVDPLTLTPGERIRIR